MPRALLYLFGHNTIDAIHLTREVECIDEPPKTPTGQIQKRKLRQAGITAKTWDRESVRYHVRRR
jgi:hypothetical protein